MNHLGKSFRLARTAKGFSQKYVAEGIISLPALSKFETGKSMVATDKFLKLLDRLALSYKEFEVSFVEANEVRQDEFLSLLSKSISTRNAYLLEQQIISEYKLYEKYKHIRHYHNYLLAKLYQAYYFKEKIQDLLLLELHSYLIDRNAWEVMK